MAAIVPLNEDLEGVSMAEIRETELPGVGLRFEFVTDDGRLVGIISHRTGRYELFLGDPDDPDSLSDRIVLTDDERRALADLLGASQITEHLTGLKQEIEGLAIDWLQLHEDSVFAGRTIGDTEARTRTGVSIVAVLRNGTTIAAPGPAERIEGGDTLVVVGTADGVQRLSEILRGP